MKTNLLKSIFISLILLVGGISKISAATVTFTADDILFFNMSAVNWWIAGTNGNGNFAYFYNNSTGKNAWSAHAVQYSGSVYYVKIPAGTWEGVILTRNNTSTAPSWNNKWNQTGNISLSSTSNYISKFSEGSTSVTWSTQKPTSTGSLAASATSVNIGSDVTLTPSLTSNTTYNEIKSTSYSISPSSGASVNGNTFTATVPGTYTVTATVTYNPRGYSSLTSTVELAVTITVKPWTITWNANGGSVSPATSEYDGATAVTLPTPTRTGYDFDGWYTAANGGTKINDIGTTTKPTANVTYHAHWTPKNYAITLNANGGASNGSATATYNSNSVTNATYPTRDHYECTGYYTATSGGTLVLNTDGTLAKNVSSYTDANGNWIKDGTATLYAQWTPNPFNITYEGLEGATHSNPEIYTVEDEIEFSKPSDRTGYDFIGWEPASIARGTTGDQIVTAQWQKKKYTVTYGVVGGENGTIALNNETPAITNKNDKNCEHGEKLVFEAYPTSGYQILGWYSDEAGNTSLDNGTANQYTIDPLTGAASVFVAFKKIPASTYIVTFDANGGDKGTMNSQSFTEKEAQNLTTNTFTRTGYTFSEWNTQANGQGTSYTDGQLVTLTTAGLTLYAQWTAKTYNVTLSQTDATTPGTESVNATFDAPMPAIAQLPTKDGYAFMGYFAEEGGHGKQYYDQNGAIDDINWDIDSPEPTLYAHFEKAQIDLTLNQDAFESDATGTVDATYTITPSHAHNVAVCWSLTYSNDRAIDNTPTIEDNVAKFSLNELSAGSYKIVASLRIGNCEGDEVAQTFAQFTKVGNYSVTVQYTCEGEQIAAAVTQAGHPSTPNTAEAPTIGGYNFVKWVLGDGITSTSTLTNKTISYTANYNGYLTATYEKKKLIFLDLSTLPNKSAWTAPHVYLYSSNAYWDDNKGIGATHAECVHKAAMVPVPAATDIWYYEYEKVPNFNGFVAFTATDKKSQDYFYDTEVIYRGDFSMGTPVFVPSAEQKAVSRNASGGKDAKYYSKGHWTKYMGGTGYTLKIYNHKEKEGREELMSVPFTGSSLYLPFTAVVDLEAGQTFGYKIVRDNDKWYKNDADGTMTVNSHTNWPFVEDNSDGLACGIQTVAAGNHTFTLTLDATSGNFNVSVDYPVTVGDYRILYKDDTRTTYKPSDIKKADELNPVTSFFVRPDKHPKLIVQTAARVTNEDITWFTSENEIFFKPNANWKSYGARFAAYFYKDAQNNKWVDLKANGNLYSCAKPTDPKYTHVIFCRMDPAKNNAWANVWTQTIDIALPSDGKNLYTLEEGAWKGQIRLKPNSNWLTQVDGKTPRFAAYFFHKEGETTKKEEWYTMYKDGNSDTYWCAIPDQCSKVIFCRMNPANETNDWSNKWNQTGDLDLPSGNDLYTINAGSWDAGSWSNSGKSWTKLDGGFTDLSSSLTTKLTEINATSDAVYTIYLSANDKIIEKVEPYTGNYYIRVDAAAGKWYDYKTNPDNLMTYSAFSEDEAAAVNGEATYKSPYSHYKTAWCEEGENVKFVIANDYSPCISDTLVQDSKFNNIDEHGNLNSGNGKYSANIRFMWNRKNNKVSRAYLAAATDQSRDFLVLKSNSTLKDAEGNDIANKKVLFDDTQNWIYETTVKVQPGTHIKLYACYPTTDVDKALYFRGEYADDSWADVNTSELLGGSGDTWYTVRVIYDFKTNRLMTALISDFSIKEDLTINADIMVVRSHHDDAQHITIANEDVELSGVKIVYGTLQFNRWILNNRGGADNHDVNSCTREEDGHRVFDLTITEQNHPALGLHEQKSLYERGLYFVSFPFDVHLSDVFGFGTYGTHWVISAYNGLRRAQRGYFMDNCVNDDCTNWDYIWEPDTFTMKANEGYLLSLDLDLMKYDNIDFWSNNRATVELYFPSMANLQTIKQVDYTMDALSDKHKCKINLNVNGDNPIADRTIKDSYWRCIGVPSFADYLGSAEWTAQNEDIPYLYEWNTVDNSLNVRSTNGFKFRSTFAYLVQNGNAIQWNAVNTQQPSQIMAKQQAAAATNYEWNISLHSQDEQVDQTYIRLTNNENVTHEFDFNQDLVKEFNYGRADIYTMIGYEPVAANSMPIENIATSVPLGIDVEKAGEYTIAMLEGTTSVGVTLVDIETGQRTNLAAGMEYTVYLAKGKHNERFMIEISPVNNAPTDIDQLTGSDLNAEGVQKYIIDGRLYLKKNGVLYDAQGHRL